MLTSASIPSALDRRVVWSAIAISIGVASGIIWQFHASRHMPVEEPWFTVLSLLPQFAAVGIYSWTKSLGNAPICGVRRGNFVPRAPVYRVTVPMHEFQARSMAPERSSWFA